MFNWNKNNRKQFEFQTRNLSLILLNGWSQYEFEDKKPEDPLTFTKNKGGVGSLQISLATSKNSELFNVHKFIEKNNFHFTSEIKQYKLKNWTIYEYENVSKDMYCKYFNLIKDNVAVFATYISNKAEKYEKELKEATEIIKSTEVVSNI